MVFRLGRNLLVVGTAMALLAGCAQKPYKSYKYNDRHSYAYNVAKAGNITDRLHDAKVPEEEYSHIINSAGYGAFDTAASALSAPSGFTSLQAGGIALGGAISRWHKENSKLDGDRLQYLAWMPESMAKDDDEAKKIMESIIVEAANKTFDQLHLNTLEKVQTKMTGYRFDVTEQTKNKSAWDCGEGKCRFMYAVQEPKFVKTPSFLEGPKNQKRYAFIYNGKYGSVFNLENWNALLVQGKDYDRTLADATTFFATFSKNLPEWVYVYIPANHINDSNGELIKMPYLLNKGKASYFLIPKK